MADAPDHAFNNAFGNVEVFPAGSEDDDDGAVPLATARQRGKVTKSDQLVEIGMTAELWHDADFVAYATMPVYEGLVCHHETYPVRSAGFRRWLLGAFGRAHERKMPGGQRVPGTPGRQALIEAIDTLEALAAAGREDTPRVRVGGLFAGMHGRAVYLDLGRPDWSVVRIDEEGWQVEERSPIPFIRPAGQRPLPVPEDGHSIRKLWRFVNIVDEADRKLVIAWLVAALWPQGPYPALILNGEQGSAKSTACRVLRRLVDPNLADLRAAPRDDRDLMLHARNSWVVALDNLSGVDSDLSDGLCRISTGAGHSTRTLYSDEGETITAVCRPIILNGIPNLATRPDLAQRSLQITLPAIGEESRRTEEQFWVEFEAAAPHILGALLNAVVIALRRLPTTVLPRSPRMADFAKLATAAGLAFNWSDGAFLEAYDRNRALSVQDQLDSDHIAVALRDLLDSRISGEWEGTATQLLGEVNGRTGESIQRERGWPKDATRLGGRLRRIAPVLREIGVEVNLDARTGKRRERTIRISRRAVTADAGVGAPDAANNPASYTNTLKHNEEIKADAADAVLPAFCSGGGGADPLGDGWAE